MKAIRNFDLNGMMGFWYVVQYYASSEEAPEYSCMRSIFSMDDEHVSIYYRIYYFIYITKIIYNNNAIESTMRTIALYYGDDNLYNMQLFYI